ncbi:hypothetical protein [Trinickia sp.]|uniref:hypothetical protein n=1 Tax=Trinickia sp. TaxID=2571163 RepID=UPI003F7CF45D
MAAPITDRLKWLPLLPLSLACMGCVAHLQEPPAAMSFVRFEKTSDAYKLTFNSNADFLAVPYTDKLPVVGHWLICSLDDDTDFSIDHAFSLRRFMRGITDSAARAGNGQQSSFDYSAELNFKETLNGGASDRVLRKTEIDSLLAGRADILCKVVMTIFGYAPYYSLTMQVPAKALLNEVDK